MITELSNLQKMVKETVSAQYEKVQHVAYTPFIVAGLISMMVIGTAYYMINKMGEEDDQ